LRETAAEPASIKVVNSRFMCVRPNLALVLCVGIGCGLFATSSAAQMAAFRDLTLGSRVPTEHLSVPQSCQAPNSSIDNSPSPALNSQDSKSLQLTILETSPAKLEIGNDFNANVRLKNVGTKPVLVPAVADGERMLRTSADGTEEKYEVGDISFRLATGRKRGIPVYLDSGGALFADPDNKSSYLSLAPGNWLDIKLHARAECGLQNCVAHIEPDDKAVLTAWWYERVLTHRVDGCREVHGSVEVRELDSAPFSVEVKEPSAKMNALAWKR
jgi:hypothetical protein